MQAITDVRQHQGYLPDDFYVRFIINPTERETYSTSSARKKGRKRTGEAEKPAERRKRRPDREGRGGHRNIKIGKVTFRRAIDFRTTSSAELHGEMLNMSGASPGFLPSRSRGKIASRNLGRVLRRYQGHFNPLAKDRYVDMDVSFKDIELSPLRPTPSDIWDTH